MSSESFVDSSNRLGCASAVVLSMSVPAVMPDMSVHRYLHQVAASSCHQYAVRYNLCVPNVTSDRLQSERGGRGRGHKPYLVPVLPKIVGSLWAARNEPRLRHAEFSPTRPFVNSVILDFTGFNQVGIILELIVGVQVEEGVVAVGPWSEAPIMQPRWGHASDQLNLDFPITNTSHSGPPFIPSSTFVWRSNTGVAGVYNGQHWKYTHTTAWMNQRAPIYPKTSRFKLPKPLPPRSIQQRQRQSLKNLMQIPQRTMTVPVLKLTASVVSVYVVALRS